MIIVNFSTKEYKAGQDRLVASLNGTRSMMFSNYQEIQSPTHQESPYQFKIHAIEKAWEQDDIVLWCDASLYRVGDLSKIETIIKDTGYFMEEAGHYVKDWCSERARAYFNLKPEEAGFTMFSAGLLGLDYNSRIAREFFNQWKASAVAGCFKGSWQNHRHDMTCGSIIAQRLRMRYQRGGSYASYIGPGYPEPNPEAVFHLQGL